MFAKTLTACRHCGHSVSYAAKCCPNCDCPDPARSPLELPLRVAVGVIAILWVANMAVTQLKELDSAFGQLNRISADVTLEQ